MLKNRIKRDIPITGNASPSILHKTSCILSLSKSHISKLPYIYERESSVEWDRYDHDFDATGYDIVCNFLKAGLKNQVLAHQEYDQMCKQVDIISKMHNTDDYTKNLHLCSERLRYSQSAARTFNTDLNECTFTCKNHSWMYGIPDTFIKF